MRIRTNIISIGILLLLLFVVAIYLIGAKIRTVGDQMNSDFVKKECRYRSEAVAFEFKKTTELQEVALELFQRHATLEIEQLFPLLMTLQHLDEKLTRVWLFDQEKGRLSMLYRKDTIFSWTEKISQGLKTIVAGVNEVGNRQYSVTYEDGQQLYWTRVVVLERHGVHYFLGFDILLADLHSYFADVTRKSRSYVFILNSEGMIISHPDEHLIGFSLRNSRGFDSLQQVLRQKNEYQMEMHSIYLGVPVTCLCYPLLVGEECWIVGVCIPLLVSQEEVNGFRQYTLMIAVITIIIFVILLWFAQYKWRKEYRLRRKVERESVELNLQQIKNQINPHFLFNSLNSLSVLIGTDSKLAKEFVLKLAKVYRYLLEQRHSTLATVGEELEFTRQYYFLQKIRYREQLDLMIEVHERILIEKIPSMSLQILVENAIKHNRITGQSPLWIKIYDMEGKLVVENNYQPRVETKVESIGVGFERIQKIYEYYSQVRFEYGQEGDSFICRLPLISLSVF